MVLRFCMGQAKHSTGTDCKWTGFDYGQGRILSFSHGFQTAPGSQLASSLAARLQLKCDGTR